MYKGRWNGVLVAVKILNAPAAEVMEDFQRECTILERLRHPNIIKYFGTASNAEGNVSRLSSVSLPEQICPYDSHMIISSGQEALLCMLWRANLQGWRVYCMSGFA